MPDPLTEPVVDFRRVLPHAQRVPFASQLNRYAGQAGYVIGRGQTTFDYGSLAAVPGPVFFINDAICLESHARGDSFFFMHDPQPLAWLDQPLKSTAVLPIDAKLFPPPPRVMAYAGRVLGYRRYVKDAELLLKLPRERVAGREYLYTHSGTIHSAIHFAWFCGITRVVLIGCDGLSSADQSTYDPRLANRSQSKSVQYNAIRRAQDVLLRVLGMEAEYRGTPE